MSEEPTKKSRFRDKQMAAIVREADHTSVAEAAEKHTVREQSISAWQKHLGELASSDVRRLKGIQAGSTSLQKQLAERELDTEVRCPRRSTAESGEPAGAARAGGLPGSGCSALQERR